MVYVAYYFIFCIATAITSWMYLFWPAVKQVKEEGVENNLMEHPVLGSIVYMAIAALTAPALFIILIVPSYSESYVNSMLEVLREENN